MNTPYLQTEFSMPYWYPNSPNKEPPHHLPNNSNPAPRDRLLTSPATPTTERPSKQVKIFQHSSTNKTTQDITKTSHTGAI
jgi:hypothetical protein